MGIDLAKGNWLLFRNTRKSEPKQPDYEGQVCLPDGRQMKLVAWIRDGANGKFFSGKLDDMPAPKRRG